MSELGRLREQRKELTKNINQIDKDIERIEKEELDKAISAVSKKINDMSDEEKQFILSHVEHDRTSCSDSNCSNGVYWTNGHPHWRCRKCALMEILNGEYGGVIDFSLDVSIYPTTV